MSGLTPIEIQKQREYETILSGILSPNTTNERIKQSEDILRELETKALLDLINCIIISLNASSFPQENFESATHSEYRQLSGSNLYRILCKEKFNETTRTFYHHWEILPNPIRERVLDGLINFIKTENTILVMKHVFHSIACLAKIVIDNGGQWNQLYILLDSFIQFTPERMPILNNDTALNIVKALKLYTELANEVMNGIHPYVKNICEIVIIFIGLNHEDPRINVDEESLNIIKDEAFAVGTGILKYVSSKYKDDSCIKMFEKMLIYMNYLALSLESGKQTSAFDNHLTLALNCMLEIFWFRPREVKMFIPSIVNLLMGFIGKPKYSLGNNILLYFAILYLVIYRY